MKHWQDYKKQFKIKVLVLLGITFLLFPVVFSWAQTVQELNEKINQKNSDIAKLEQEISQYQKEIENLGKQKNSLSVSIKQLDLTKKKLTADISVTQNKIDKTNLKILELSLEINDKQGIISNNLKAISSDIRRMDELERQDIWETMLSEKDFTTIWNEIDNIMTVSNKIREEIVELKEAKSDLEDTREETTNAKNELLSLKSKLADQKKIVEQNTAEKNRLLKQTQNKEASYQKLLKEQLALKNAFEKELQDYESQLKFILDPSKLPAKGVLSWPLDYVYITQLFGVTKDSKRLYASGSHSGVDFRASVGTPVKAMADGIVIGTGNTDSTCYGASFGKWVLIEYNNGLSSTYGHLSLFKVASGQKVKRGEVVAYSGNTGHTTGPHLHVSLYVSRDASNKPAVSIATIPSKACPGKSLTQPVASRSAYLDPVYYLPAYK